MTVIDVLKKQGIETLPDDYYQRVEIWNKWYKGYDPEFHDYRVYNGQTYTQCKMGTAGLPKLACEDWADLLMNEKVKITLEGEKEQKFIDKILKANHMNVRFNAAQEVKCALGTAAYIPRVVGVKVDADGKISGDAKSIKIDLSFGDNILPISWENGEITECAFGTRKVKGESEYYYVQIHRLNSHGEYDIENRLYNAKNEVMTEVPLSSLREFERLPKTIHTGSEEPQFVIDKLPIVDKEFVSNPMGVAVFANAIYEAKGCDIILDSYQNEFRLGKKRVMVKVEAMKDIDGNLAFDPNDAVFYAMPEDSQTDPLIHEINMQLRSGDHNAAMQDWLNLFSLKCGFGENHYRFNNGAIATATEVVSANSTMFRKLKKNEIPLKDTLETLVRMLLRLGNTYMSAGLNEEVEMSIDFDDSIIEDDNAEFQRDLVMLNAGIINRYEFRMKWMNEDEETAKEALPQPSMDLDDGTE